VTPFGAGVPAFWAGVRDGRRALAPVRRFAAGDLAPRIAGEVPDDDGDPDRAGSFALTAAFEALEQAGLVRAGVDPLRLGVALGTTLGGMQLFEGWCAGAAVEGEAIPYFAPAVRLARALGVGGPVATPQLACASGTAAVALAADWVRSGAADVVVAGGTDILCRFVLAGFNSLRATAEEARPFDRDRRGLVLGEGAAVVVIEAADHAARRGAMPLARVLGSGAAADAVHMTAPDREGRGAARAMMAALDDADLAPRDVDFVSAHGTGTLYNDAMEAVALRRVFDRDGPPIDSIKGAIGHTLGAAGAIEAVLCTLVLAEGLVPPTAGLTTVDEACAGLDLVAGEARAHPARVALSTSSGFAGANAALVLGRA